MESGMHTNYSHLCVFVLCYSIQSEATFVLLSHHVSFRSFLKMAVYHLEGRVPKMNLGEKRLFTSRSVRIVLHVSNDWMCSSPCYSSVIRLEEIAVYVMLEWDSCRNTAFNQSFLLQTTTTNMNLIRTTVVSYLHDVRVHMLPPWPSIHHVPVNV